MTASRKTFRPAGRRWQRVRKQIGLRDNFRCQICGAVSAAGQVDHIQPLADGGAPYDPENLRWTCAPCNQRRRLSPEQIAWRDWRPPRQPG